jgi:hypothetical protein
VKRFLSRRWVVPAATLVLTLSIGSAAFAATGSSSTDTSAADTSTVVTNTVTSSTATSTDAATSADTNAAASDSAKRSGDQRTDETLLTGDTLTKVQAAAVAKVGSDATVVRVETDADGNAAYEAHMTKADGTCVTVYVDESFNVVSVEDQAARGSAKSHDSTESSSTDSTSTDSTSTNTN